MMVCGAFIGISPRYFSFTITDTTLHGIERCFARHCSASPSGGYFLRDVLTVARFRASFDAPDPAFPIVTP
jgi:hypothetical protein